MYTRERLLADALDDINVGPRLVSAAALLGVSMGIFLVCNDPDQNYQTNMKRQRLAALKDLRDHTGNSTYTITPRGRVMAMRASLFTVYAQTLDSGLHCTLEFLQLKKSTWNALLPVFSAVLLGGGIATANRGSLLQMAIIFISTLCGSYFMGSGRDRVAFDYIHDGAYNAYKSGPIPTLEEMQLQRTSWELRQYIIRRYPDVREVLLTNPTTGKPRGAAEIHDLITRVANLAVHVPRHAREPTLVTPSHATIHYENKDV